MDERDDRLVEEGVARYLAAKGEGQAVIRGRWRKLAHETRATLVQSGFYSPRGERHDPDGSETSFHQHDAEVLEQVVGVFRLCLAAKLPLGTEKGTPIPHEAFTEEVLSAAINLLLVREWHDPDFLRLALEAIAKHQQARALSMYTPKSSPGPAWGCLGAIFKAALVLTMPVALAAALASAARQDVGGAALGFYFVAFGVLAILSMTGIGMKKKEGFELAYDRWTRFQLSSATGVTGAGALEHLREMARDGVAVPSIAFDLAETLRCRVASGGFSESKASAAELT